MDPNKENETKKFALELDVIETSGIEAILRFTEGENLVFVDIPKLEKEAKNRMNRNRGAIEEVLKFLTDKKNKCRYHPETKTISIGDNKQIHYDRKLISGDTGFVHITKDPSRKSELMREGKKVDSPKFLIYGGETLKEGVQYLTCNKTPSELTRRELEKLIEKAEINPINNQYFIVSNNESTAIWQLKYTLIPLNDERTRFSIDEDNFEYILITPDEILKQSNIPNFMPRNLEQFLAFNSICDPDCEVIIISGGSGSGKTVSSYAGAVNCIMQNNANEQDAQTSLNPESIILFKADNIVGGKSRDPGALPGGMDKKKEGIMKSFEDAHNAIELKRLISYQNMFLAIQNSVSKKERRRNEEAAMRGEHIETKPQFFKPGVIPITNEFLQFARGRTFERKIIYIDEMQNYTPYEAKQLVERGGRGSKIIISGDPEQLDDFSGRLDRDYNGLTFVANALYDEHPRMSIISFDENFRLQAADIMRRKSAPRD